MEPVASLHHSRHRAGARRRTVVLAALGARIAVGDSPARMVLGWLVLAAVMAVSLIRKERIGPCGSSPSATRSRARVPIYLMRSSRFTALELAQTLRYFPDLVVVLALLRGRRLLRAQPRRVSLARRLPARTAVTVAAAAAFVASSLYSTATFTDDLARQPDQPYLQNAEASLAKAHPTSERSDARPGGRPLVLAARRRAGEPGQPHVRAAPKSS